VLLKIHPERISDHKISQIVQALRGGGVIIYPTDTIYAIGCDIYNHKACEKVFEFKQAKKKGFNYSFVCSGLGQLSDYATHVNTPVYKLMKQVLPGPYTFILNASSKVPTIFKAKKKTIGIRVPDNAVTQAIIEALGNPLLSTTLHKPDDDFLEYESDPELMHDRFGKRVDMVVDAGPGGLTPSTILDCTGAQIQLVREGLGPVDMLDIV